MSTTTPRRGQWYVRFRVGTTECAAGPFGERTDAVRAREFLEPIEVIRDLKLWRGLDPLGGEEQRDGEDGSECGTEDFRYR